MSERFEYSFNANDGAELFYQAWEPENPRGTIVVTHGIAEHSDCYVRFADELTGDGWRVVAMDLRGHGKSSGKRGYIEDFDLFCKDLHQFYEINTEIHPDKPLFCFGHSLGGLITLKTLIRFGFPKAAALCLSSPALGIALEVPKLKEKFAEIAGEWMPKLTLANEINYEDLHRDRELHEEYRKDTLRHDRISPRLFLGMRDSMAEVIEAAPQIEKPLLLQLSGEDRLVSTPDAQDFFERVGAKQKEIFVYGESYHEIFNDLDRAHVFKDFKNFIGKF